MSRSLILTLGLLLVASVGAVGDEPAGPPLALSEPIACRAVRGYGDYDALDEPALTKDEKLLLYVQPSNHTIEPVGDKFRVHLTEDLQIRRKGQKRVLWSRQKIVEFRTESPERPERLYLGTTVGLKSCTPGTYVAEITLNDQLAPGGARTTRSFEFRVIPTPAPARPGR